MSKYDQLCERLVSRRTLLTQEPDQDCRDAAAAIRELERRVKDADEEIKDLRYHRGEDWASMAADV